MTVCRSPLEPCQATRSSLVKPLHHSKRNQVRDCRLAANCWLVQSHILNWHASQAAACRKCQDSLTEIRAWGEVASIKPQPLAEAAAPHISSLTCVTRPSIIASFAICKRGLPDRLEKRLLCALGRFHPRDAAACRAASRLE